MRNAMRKLDFPKYKVEVLLLQNYELSKFYEGDPQGNQDDGAYSGSSPQVSMGLKPEISQKAMRKIRKENSKEDQDRLIQEKYEQEMAELSRKFPKNYMDCRYFAKWNKAFFVLTLVFQLMQSMGYNGLYDIPQLFMILILFSFFAYRKSAPRAYACFTLFFIYYIGVAVVLKTLYSIFLHIPIVSKWVLSHQEKTVVVVLQTLFGQRLKSQADDGLGVGSSSTESLESITYRISSIGTLICAKGWVSAKWCQIREKTQVLKDGTWWWIRYSFFLRYKDEIVSKDQRLEEHLKEIRKQHRGRQNLAKNQQAIVKKFKKFNSDLLGAFKSDLNKYLPTMCIWWLRIGLGFQAYLYHSSLGIFHLAYVLLTFLSGTKFALCFSIFIMLPMYTLEFVIVYGMKISAVNHLKIFQVTKMVFLSKLEMPILEQSLYFVNLAFFFMSISCVKLGFDTRMVGYAETSQDAMVELITRKIIDKNSSSLWRIGFFIGQYIHVITLCYLFILGTEDMDKMRSLAFMIFFTFYTASESLYRKTNKLLLLYMCYLILGAYYYSLVIQRF